MDPLRRTRAAGPIRGVLLHTCNLDFLAASFLLLQRLHSLRCADTAPAKRLLRFRMGCHKLPRDTWMLA